MLHGQNSAVRGFYENRSIFITGATGFLGKVLLEKLLRSCPGIKNVFVLMRRKWGNSPNQRLEELLTCKVFDLVKKEYPEALMKVIAVKGDISLTKLGISEAHMSAMAEDVSVVFHLASSVELDEPIKEAIETNILGTRKVMELCRKFPKIEALVHLSTTFSNCNRNEVKEVVYPSPFPLQHFIEMTKSVETEILEAVVPKIVGDRPNIYTLTKALAENLLVEECGKLPVAIVRPSIITSTWREPFPGWIDTYNGTSGMTVAIGKGILRTFLNDVEVPAEVIPVDVVSNLMIAVAWHTAIQRPNGIVVYNSTSGGINKLSWGKMNKYGVKYMSQYPSEEIFRYPAVTPRRNKLSNKVNEAIHHYLPAFLIDLMAYILFQQPWMVKLYQKIHKTEDKLQYLGTREWNFHCNNITILSDLMSEQDRETFFFDIKTLNWDEFMDNQAFGSRTFLLKEDPATIPAARKKLRRQYILSQIRQLILVFGVWKVIISKFVSINGLYDLGSTIFSTGR